ncbi:hypothetical protein HNV08_06155 [Winogradskyella eckloniae]|uniref:hypothetical protein n=1 Tax=Winogradskyella eckloniae TaxID=1089306 RepID=UPI001566AE3B|nr:hypothetical protein [Winogradskyella eckloniae]NRD19623.1 hypothetical protein [Winogradskyella eckloniae]
MKNKFLFMCIITASMFQISHSQKLQQNEVEKLKALLNSNVATQFRVELKNDSAFCKIDDLNKTLDLRDSYEIAEDSTSKKTKKKLSSGPHEGPVFWKYNFQSATNSSVEFRTNKYQQLFCTIHFKNQDTISLKSSLNAYTSNHKTSDSALHKVDWTGDKYISLLLTPIKIEDQIKFELKGITISGKFARSDSNELSKQYVKSLRNILKREFKLFFESHETVEFIEQKTNN